MGKSKVPYNSPVGRLVQGDCFVAQTKDQTGALRVVKSGPNIGQPNPQFFVAIAVPKSDPLWPGFMQMLYDAAKAEWPAMFPPTGVPAPLYGIQAVHPVNPVFTFKVKDGDGLDRNGKRNADKEGFAGHWIVSAASSYAPKCAKPTSPGAWETLTDPESIKRGYWIRLAGSFASNDSVNTPGMYVNLDLIELAGLGTVIVGGADFATAFATPAALPVGVSATPTLGASSAGPVMLPGAGGTYAELIAAGWTNALLIQHGKMAAPAAAVTPPPPPGAAAVTPPPPPGAAAVTPPPPPGVVTPPAGPTMLPGAGGTYAELIAAGWTDALLIQHGKMAAPDPGFLAAGPGGPPATGAVVPPPPGSASVATASPTRTMTAAAGGATYEAMITAGWTEAQLITGGYLIVS
jgi:hypothetical protein